MPAAFTTGIRTGVNNKMVGVMSKAVPTMMVMIMMVSINKRGLSSKGCSKEISCAGKLATVINQAETMAAATKNITMALVLAAATNKGKTD
jgi:hypothetical protein